jgi:hypothetical protein
MSPFSLPFPGFSHMIAVPFGQKAIFVELTVLPSLAPHLAFHLDVPHTPHKRVGIAVME